MYTVSIIVPVYNAGKNLVNNIQSLISQDLKSIEIIIVNDASTDETASVINSLAVKYPNIKPIHLPINQGVHEARLFGIKNSTAPWIGFMDSDDFARPHMFSKMLKEAEKNQADIVICGADRVTCDRKKIRNILHFKRNQLIQTDIFERFCRFEFGTGMLWNKLYRKSIIMPFHTMHFPWRQDNNEDLILNIGCFYKAKKIYLIKDSLYEYVLNEDSTTQSIDPNDAFIEHFRAYALAINTYHQYGDNISIEISEIYRKQLANYAYPLKDYNGLVNNKQRLYEAVDLLNKVNPFALVLIAINLRPKILGRKEMIKYLAKSFFT